MTATGIASKSMPPNEFQIFVSSADSGIDSDASNSTNKIYSSVESFDDDNNPIDPKTLIAGKTAPYKDRVDGIDRALNWLRDELVKMKETDKRLAKSFINMRTKIAEYKKVVDSGGLLAIDRPTHLNTKDDSECIRLKKKMYKDDEWKAIAKDSAFPTNGLDFDNNKRATWVI